MKDVQFHAVMPTSRASKSASKKHPHNPFTRNKLEEAAAFGQRVEVFALHTEGNWRRNPGGAGLVFDPELHPNCWSDIGYTGVSLEWLDKRTVRVSEDLAKRLHPEIVEYMRED